IFLERAAARRGQAEFGAGDASFERLVAGDVLRLFELAGVDAQVAVGGLKEPLEVVEREPLVHRKRADDAQPKTLVNQPIQRERTLPGSLGATADWGVARPEQRRSATGDCFSHRT